MKVRSLSALLLLWPLSAAAGSPAALDRCEATLAAKPESRDAAACFWTVATEQGLAAEADRRLEAFLPRFPDAPWIPFYLGNIRWSEPHRAEASYRRAASAFAARRDAAGELKARNNLYVMLTQQGKMREASAEAERVASVAEASGDAELAARAKILLARHLYDTGGDLGRAALLLDQAETALFPAGDYYARRDWLQRRAPVALELGRRREARDAYQRLAALTAEAKDALGESNARYGLARVAFEEAAELPSEGAVREAQTLTRKALAVGSAAGDRDVEALAHHLLAMMESSRTALAHLESCLEVAATDRDRSYCLHALTRRLADRDPRAARSTLERAFRLARQAADPWSLILCWRERMRLAWVDATPEQALAEGRAALEVIEALHDVQRNSGRRAELFSTWAEDYHWLSGKLLQTGHGPDALAAAFSVTERMRARSLVESLAAAGKAPRSDPALAARRAAVLEELARVQRRLLEPGLPAAAREAVRREQQRLEIAEAGLRERLAEGAGDLAAHRRPDFASLARVRRALAADEALLSFQVAPWQDAAGRFAGGAWLLAVTRHGARVYRLPGRVELRPTLAMFDGLFAARAPDREATAARALHDRLLAQALGDLPAGVQRLVLVPDDDLHRLPFAALRGADGAPLATRYQLTVVPSATLWLRWRASRPLPGARPALALADPPAPGAGKAASASVAAGRRGAPAERAAVFAAMHALPPLPYARGEGRAVVRHLGRGSVLRVGEEASEAFLKRDGGSFGLLHFAAHALLDDEQPERSFVLLAPGARGEDGLLQAREIAELDLAGDTVVLASCRSASGRLLRGEGVMGLARAFFQAGAHAVVASLWRLRDDEAEALFSSFYRHLGRGESLAAALRAAQIERIRAGAPAAAWAGLVVLGDGELVPVRPRPERRWVAAAVLAAVAAGAAVYATRRRPEGGRV
ncbi:MAG TPA: CHAT domain-containing protein [Thermoanaerobaculia bacterium]|nr:CHAT domain-containing protein [Thermoanaerobaculia bacterium]